MYKEPGVYLQVQNNARGAIAGGVAMIPFIIGSGAAKLKKQFTMTRSLTGQEDTFPVTSALSIAFISSSKVGSSQWVETTDPLDTQDYVFVTTENVITWETGKGPTAGATYYVTLVYAVEDPSQYEPRLVTAVSEVIDAYGPDIQENETGTPVCPISLGAQLALSGGAAQIYTLQVKISGSEIAAVDYQTALDTYAKFIPQIWRIVPMDSTVEIQAAVTGHMNLMSTVEERMERCAFYSKPYTIADPAPTQFDGTGGVLDVIGNYAQSIQNKRINAIYPDVATRTLSNGIVTELPGQYILAMLAGIESTLPIARSRTRVSIPGFINLGGVKMTRSEKNMLAEKGVMILDQAASGANLVIRHQLSTDMSSTQSRETSILAVQDYASKYLRSVCEQYIGKFNITPEVITMISNTISGAFTTMKNQAIIVNGKVDTIYQDQDNPDTVIASVSVLPPYPCNYIEITLVLE